MKIKQSKVIVNNDNIDTLRKISPRTTPQFSELSYTNANKYWTCLQVYDFPEEIGRGFLEGVIKNDNIIVTIDETDIEMEDMLGFLGKKVDNGHEDSFTLTKFKDKLLKKKEVQRSAEFINYLEDRNKPFDDKPKCITIRLYMHEETEEDLKKLVNDTKAQLRKLKAGGYIQTNDLETDYRAITQLDNPVKEIVTTNVMTDFMLQSGASMVKPAVSIIGQTYNGVYADDFGSYQYSSFCAMIMGMQGSGKSSLFKRILEDNILRGDNAYIFDIHFNEYREIAMRYGIPMISFSKDNHINGYEIFTVTDIKTGVIAEHDISCNNSLMLDIIKNLVGLNDNAEKLLKITVAGMYKQYVGHKLSEFTHKDWFTISDIKTELRKKIDNKEIDEKLLQYAVELELTLESMIEDYGYLYDHKTNIDVDLSKSLYMDISFIKNYTDKRIASSWITLMFAYVRGAMVINERYNNEQEKGKDKSKLVCPAKFGAVVFDEWGEYATSRPLLIQTESMVKASRKARFGFMFALHTINDIDKEKDKNGDLIRSIFNLCSVKIIGESEEETVKLLPDYVKGLDKDDMQVISQFKKGKNNERTFLAVNSKSEKIVFVSLITKRQQTYFGGGV